MARALGDALLGFILRDDAGSRGRDGGGGDCGLDDRFGQERLALRCGF